MAANRNIGVLFLLLICGIYSPSATPAYARAKACPQFCKEAKYMRCKKTRHKKQSPACNCCFVAGKGCTIYYSDGTKSVCKKVK
ncbi:hypothetical protein RHGRI_038649 [Rhododendron griersonianum]|uniref:Uncharacterized protein n=1 Tax=Rhododendron griersonianum TaxID=479676 RepID=A0AAV6HP76_9ERIC|nr:hypothetical protein RHGRI_038649 [Rhododendron griersonianum]